MYALAQETFILYRGETCPSWVGSQNGRETHMSDNVSPGMSLRLVCPSVVQEKEGSNGPK